ncbi:basic salivary proline-rich protein 2-like [Ochotona princeps]|uniref:basic salivary proline-rich protein 2-like n=1 Tax=Ochotona princeps TaxID=9978 RepID=UPI0027145CB7|nr:basic salivary proline-rich protein 2-like [Ochotona princeps]
MVTAPTSPPEKGEPPQQLEVSARGGRQAVAESPGGKRGTRAQLGWRPTDEQGETRRGRGAGGIRSQTARRSPGPAAPPPHTPSSARTSYAPGQQVGAARLQAGSPVGPHPTPTLPASQNRGAVHPGAPRGPKRCPPGCPPDNTAAFPARGEGSPRAGRGSFPARRPLGLRLPRTRPIARPPDGSPTPRRPGRAHPGPGAAAAPAPHAAASTPPATGHAEKPRGPARRPPPSGQHLHPSPSTRLRSPSGRGRPGTLPGAPAGRGKARQQVRPGGRQRRPPPNLQLRGRDSPRPVPEGLPSSPRTWEPVRLRRRLRSDCQRRAAAGGGARGRGGGCPPTPARPANGPGGREAGVGAPGRRAGAGVRGATSRKREAWGLGVQAGPGPPRPPPVAARESG